MDDHCRVPGGPSFRALCDASPDAIAVLDPTGLIRWVNLTWSRWAVEHGQSPDFGLGQSYLAQVQDPELAPVREALVTAGAGRRIRFRHQYACHSPEVRRWFDMLVVPVAEAPGWVLVVHRDVTDRALLEEEIRHLADHDPLTGLANRRRLRAIAEERFAAARAGSTPLALFCIDLDGFKALNDRFGHLAGDALLREVAVRLRAVCREEDLVARVGGDEFVVLVAGLSPGECERLGARLERALEDPVPAVPGAIVLSGSIGRSSFPEDGGSLRDLFAAADRAMYRRKRSRTGPFPVTRPPRPFPAVAEAG